MRCLDIWFVFLFDFSDDDVGQCLLLLARLHFGLSDSPSVAIPFGYAT